MKRQVSLNNNSFDRAGITKDCKDGVCEYIWNGFEAGASKVSVALQGTPLQEAMALLISDNGTGIPYESFDDKLPIMFIMPTQGTPPRSAFSYTKNQTKGDEPT